MQNGFGDYAASVLTRNITPAPQYGTTYAQVWTTTPEGTYGAGESIDIYVGFRFPVMVESATAFLYINTEAGGT